MFHILPAAVALFGVSPNPTLPRTEWHAALLYEARPLFISLSES